MDVHENKRPNVEGGQRSGKPPTPQARKQERQRHQAIMQNVYARPIVIKE